MTTPPDSATDPAATTLSAAPADVVYHRPYPSADQAGQRIIWWAIGINALLAIGKFAVGLTTYSAALLADAWQTLGDVAHSTATLFALRYAAKPADANHPYGHGNVETLASLLVAGILLATGLFIVLEGAQVLLDRLNPTGDPVVPSLIAAGMAGVSMIAKIMLAARTSRLARTNNSPLLHAAASDHWQDVLTSGVVVIAVIGANLGLPWLDPAAAILVGLAILGLTAATVRGTLQVLLAETPTNSTLGPAIAEAAFSIKGVKDVHNLKIHPVGAWQHVTVDVAVPGEMSVDESHAIAVEVGQRIAATSEWIGDVHVAVDPWYEGQVYDSTRHRPFHIDSVYEKTPSGRLRLITPKPPPEAEADNDVTASTGKNERET